MRILFFSMGSENLGVEYLAAVLQRQGHLVALAHDPALFKDKEMFDSPLLGRIFSRQKRIIEQSLAWKPDILCFSVITDTYQWALSIAEAIRRRTKIPILFGGIHPTSVPDRVIRNPFIDMVCVGEGEGALVDYVNSMQSGQKRFDIPNIWFKKDGTIIKNTPRPLIPNLDNLPFPAKRLYSFYDQRFQYLIITSRGCPYNCSFCANSVWHSLHGKSSFRPRRRSVENVIDELIQAKRVYRIKEIAFMDDVFTQDREWLERFLELYLKHIRLPFRCQGHVSTLDIHTAKILKEMGCNRIKFGVQTLDEQTRRQLLLRYETNAQIDRALEICGNVGLIYHVDHIFTPLDNDADNRDAALYYAGKRGLKKILVYNLSYFPATPLFKDAVARGELTQEEINSVEEGIGTYYSGNGVGRGKAYKNFRTYGSLYRIVPILSRFQVKILLRLKVQDILGITPSIFLTFLDILVAILCGDMAALNYGISLTKNYWRSLFRRENIIELRSY